MKDILKNKYFVSTANFAILLFFVVFLTFKLRFAYVMNDDIVDLIVADQPTFYHGRFFSELISFFTVKILPNILKINIQDFAIISEGLFKAVCFVILIHVIGKVFYNDKQYNIFICFLNILTFFTLFSMLFDLNFINCFSTLQFFNGYLSPLILFILLWLRLLNLYKINNIQSCNNIEFKSFVYIILLSVLTTMGNEEIGIVSFLIVLNIILKNILKREKLKTEFLIAFLSISITSFFVFTSKGLTCLWDWYNLKINLNVSFSNLANFTSIFYNEIICKNYLLWFPIVFMFCTLYTKKHRDEETKQILTFNLFSYVSFFIFFFALFFLGETNVYQNEEIYKYWITYPALLIGFKVFLYVSNLSLYSQIHSKYSRKYKILFIFVLLISILIYNFNNFEKIYLSDYNAKRTIYIADKYSVFYFRKKQTAILPKENIDCIMPISNNLMPVDLNTEAYKSKIYYKEKYSYLYYINYLYNVDVSYGMKFDFYKNAESSFFKNGGTLTEEELKNLKFSNI